jgi:hypothetical protein
MAQITVKLTSDDRETLREMQQALFLRTTSDLVAYLCDRYRAGALHIIPAFSSDALYREQNERIERMARSEARKECMAVLYEERFITDPKVR